MPSDYPFSRFLNIRSAYYPTFRSDGRKLAFIANISGVPQVWQVEGSPKADIPWPDPLTFDSERVMSVQYSPVHGDQRLIFTRDVGGNENAQIYLLPGGAAPEILLTGGFEGSMHIPGEWSRDGRYLLFSANRRDPGLFDLYLLSLETGEARLVWQNDRPGYLRDATFSPDGQRALLVRDIASFEVDLLEIDLGEGSVQLLNLSGEKTRYERPAYLPDGRSAVLLSDHGSDFMYAARLDLGNKTLTRLADPPWDVESLALSPKGDRLAYAVNAGGASELWLLDLKRRRGARPAPALHSAAGVIGPYYADEGRLVFSPDGRRLAFSFTSPDHPCDVYLWDFRRKSVQPVTRAAQAGLPAEAFTLPEQVYYPSFDVDEQNQTRQVPAWFFQPKGSPGPLPAIVFVHGGPESQLRPVLDPVIQYFAQSGYAVLAPNVRGSTGYGKAYSHLDDVYKRMDSVLDLASAALWLKGRAGIDGDRLVVFGASYGGFMVLASLTSYPELWAAGVDIVGIASFVTFLENTSAYRRPHREAEYGSLAENRDFLESISPLNRINRIRAPLMVIHGRNDPRVPFSEAEQVVDALRKRGVPVEFLAFEDEGHGLVRLKNRLVAYPAIAEFLEKYLGR